MAGALLFSSKLDDPVAWSAALKAVVPSNPGARRKAPSRPYDHEWYGQTAVGDERPSPQGNN